MYFGEDNPLGGTDNRVVGFRVGRDMIKFTSLLPGYNLCKKVLADNENVLLTSPERIHIAQVREYEYDTVDRLEELTRKVDILTMVGLCRSIEKKQI